MWKTDVIRREADDAQTAAEPLTGAFTPAMAGAALKQMSRRARDLTTQASRRASREIARRRGAAAETLEGLAGALRAHDPTHRMRRRRRTSAIAGGSALALTAALAAGVALGVYLSRRAKAKKDEGQAASAAEAATPGVEAVAAPPMPQAAPVPFTG